MSALSLTVLCVALFVLTVVSAAIPLHLTLSSGKIELVSKLACGILLGAAMGIVIPEGFNAVYEASSSGGDEQRNEFWTGLSLLAGFALMFMIDSWAPHSHSHPGQHRPRQQQYYKNGHSRRRSASLFDVENTGPDGNAHDHDDNEEEASPLAPMPSPSSRNLLLPEHEQSSNKRPPYSLVLGLLAHSLADGISLGASGSQSLSAIVFVAIALHKAPTAFALTTLLLAQNCSKWFVRHTILIFSLSAPLGAIATKAILSIVEKSDERLTGLVLCFSGGSFLFVAAETIKGGNGNGGDQGGEEGGHGKRRSIKDVLLTVTGMALPIFLGSLVKHSHGASHDHH